MGTSVILTVNDTLEENLQKNHAPFHQLPKEQFGTIQRTFTRVRSMIYRSTEVELSNGHSQVTYYSLCYKRKTSGTTYYVASAKFQVPPSEFLGEREECKVIQWFSRDKGKFLRNQQAPTNFSPHHLTEVQKQEIEICSQIFEQLDDIDEELCLQINSTESDTELPTFDLGFDFLYP